MLLRMHLTSLVCLFALTAWAADPPAPAAGSKAEEFAKISKEFNDLVAKTSALRAEYTASTDAAKKAEIAKQYNELREKAMGRIGELVSAAKNAYEEAPNADAKVTEVLLGTLFDQIGNDDYEPAFALGKLLMDKKCPEKEVAALAGVAAYCVNEYDLADAWLGAAQRSGALAKITKQLQARDQATAGSDQPRAYSIYPELIEQSKAAWAKEKKIREAEAKANDLPRVLLKTNKGDIEIELFENEAPNTVLNFITLVDKGAYNGLKFHRVLPAFMAQGGDPAGNGSGGPGYTIPCECHRPDHRTHFRGTLSMAHAGRDTGGSQFFLTFVETSFLDGKHTVFGRVVQGFDVLAKIKRINPEVSTSEGADKIVEAKVIRKRLHAYEEKDLKKSGKERR
jgi:cyclophilin family peptidyl-prolyl cis-trans isomerase